jgi:NADH-quinone oxidoreductase subunit N
MLFSISFFERALYPLYNSYQAQTYFGLVLYLFLAMALCGLLASVAYLFSLSSVQDSEKRSEYECGFEPFDSATRLPFDVHFYLVGILFLVFDVEIALLFPWVLSLRTSGWFGFYLMLGFIVLLAIGFLYEWKRGALIWPSRQQELPYAASAKELSVLLIIFPFDYVGRELSVVLFLVTAIVPYYLLGILSMASVAVPVQVPANLYRNNQQLVDLVAVVDKTAQLSVKVASTRVSASSSLSVAEDYLTVMSSLKQTWIPSYRKAIKNLTQRVQASAFISRSNSFHEESFIAKSEHTAFNNLARAGTEYTALKTLYQTLRKTLLNSPALMKTYHDLKQKRRLEALLKRHLATIRATVDLKTAPLRAQGRKPTATMSQLKALRVKIARVVSMSKTEMAAVDGALQRSKMSYLADLRSRRIQGQAGNSVLSFVLPVVTVTPADASSLHFLGYLLPELGLTVLLAIVLTLLAVGLGQARSKKNLALESLAALRHGLSFVLGLYVMQLCCSSEVSFFNGYVLTSAYIIALKFLVVFSGRFILSSSESYLRAHPRHLLEYPITLTLAVLFMLLLVSAGHLISAFLALVGFSLNLYVLILFDATTAVAREAGVKYFYLSTISSGLMLYGIFLIFLITGTGHFLDIGQILATESELVTLAEPLLQLAITFLFVGLFFKLSAFPGHLWAAEVYEGSPDPIMAFFMLPVKVAVLAFVLQLLATAFEPAVSLWQPLLMTSAIFSLVWGCLAALAERKTKRFLAYASINQIGFLLLGVSSGAFEGYRATLFYLFIYAIMNIGFLVVFLHTRRSDGKSLVYLTDFRGLGQQYPQYSWSIAMILLSMAGIPPLAGFFGKYYLLLHAQEQELYGLVIVGLAASLVSTYYYLRIIKILWFEGHDGMTSVSCVLTRAQALTLRFAEWSLWAFIVYAGPVLQSLDALVGTLLVFNDFFVM